MDLIKDILQGREVFTVRSGATIKDTVNYMASKGVGLVPVMNDEKLVGVFSERDLVKRVIAKDKDLNSTFVDDVMETTMSHENPERRLRSAK